MLIPSRRLSMSSAHDARQLGHSAPQQVVGPRTQSQHRTRMQSARLGTTTCALTDCRRPVQLGCLDGRRTAVRGTPDRTPSLQLDRSWDSRRKGTCRGSHPVRPSTAEAIGCDGGPYPLPTTADTRICGAIGLECQPPVGPENAPSAGPQVAQRPIEGWDAQEARRVCTFDREPRMPRRSSGAQR